MSLLIAILTDLCHFIKIVMAMNLFGNFEKRDAKCKSILAAVIIVLASGIIYFDEKMKVGAIVYFVTTYVVFRIWYAEKRKLLLLFSIWIPFMMSMIDTMFLILVKLFLGLLPFDIKSFEELMASVLSLMFIYTVGYIYRKHYQYGLKKIEYKNLVLLTVLIVVNSVVVITIANVAIGTSYLLTENVIFFYLLLVPFAAFYMIENQLSIIMRYSIVIFIIAISIIL